MRTNLPPVQLDIHSSWFDMLIMTLERNATVYEDEKAAALKDELMKYSRSFVDNDGQLCADIRLYPRKAADLIFQLLIASECVYNPSATFCKELRRKGERP